MSKRAEEKAREYEDSLDYYHYTSDNPSVAYKAGYEQAEEDFIERLAKFYPTLDYTFRSYLLQDFPELESKIKNCD